MEQIPVNPITVTNLFMGLAVMSLSGWYFIKGRRSDRVFMGINFYAGLWVVALLSIILYDRIIYDLFDEQSTRYLIASTLLVVLGSKVANILRIGKKRNGN